MDSAEEKLMEVEALQSIFMEHIKVVDPDHLEITLLPSIDAEDTSKVGVLMAVDISGTYPQTAPIIALTPIKGKTFVTSKLCDQLLQEVNELAEQNVGMPSIYLLAQHVQEHMSDLSVQREGQRKTASDEEEEEEVMDSDEEDEEEIDWKDDLTVEERDGEPVTMEGFIQWKEKFDADRKKNTNTNTNLSSSEGGVKLTGRQFFEIETNRADVDWELFATEVVSEDLRDQLEKELLDE